MAAKAAAAQKGQLAGPARGWQPAFEAKRRVAHLDYHAAMLGLLVAGGNEGRVGDRCLVPAKRLPLEPDTVLRQRRARYDSGQSKHQPMYRREGNEPRDFRITSTHAVQPFAMSGSSGGAKPVETGVYCTNEEQAAAKKINASYVNRILRMTLLAADIAEAILDGHSCEMSLAKLMQPLASSWAHQTSRFCATLSAQNPR
jgi:hypothetical protein